MASPPFKNTKRKGAAQRERKGGGEKESRKDHKSTQKIKTRARQLATIQTVRKAERKKNVHVESKEDKRSRTKRQTQKKKTNESNE